MRIHRITKKGKLLLVLAIVAFGALAAHATSLFGYSWFLYPNEWEPSPRRFGVVVQHQAKYPGVGVVKVCQAVMWDWGQYANVTCGNNVTNSPWVWVPNGFTMIGNASPARHTINGWVQYY